MPSRSPSRAEDWPTLPPVAWEDTRATLHMCTQIIGKIRLAQAPMVNHWWQVPLYVTSRGLTTSPIPYGARTFQIDFDFIAHRLVTACGSASMTAGARALACGRGRSPTSMPS